MPTATYRATDFVAAARAIGVELVIASDEAPPLGGDDTRSIAVPLDDTEAAAAAIVELDARRGIDAIVALDDQGIMVAASAAERLGLPHHGVDAVARTRDKEAMREALRRAEVPQPRFVAFDDAEQLPTDLPYPWVVKPVGRSASQGVIRADDADQARDAATWALEIAGGGRLLAEEFVPGDEVAVEGLLQAGDLTVLAVFDKPDPLDGPYFEETIYVTPSRQPNAVLDSVARATADACTAIGLTEGPIHAELRVHAGRVSVIEVAARSIGGLCARSLRFGAGISLEEVILRHALGMDVASLEREAGASGVMMLPIPRAGRLDGVDGRDAARAVPGVVGLEITIPPGRMVQPLPEGDRYLGFVFARAETPAAVEAALRAAHAALDIQISPAAS